MDPGFIFIMNDGNDVKTGFQVNIFSEDIRVRSPDHALLLVAGHGLFRFRQGVAAPGFHFYDDQVFLILRNEVYFIVPRPPVLFQDEVSQFLKVRGGDFFALFAEFVVFCHVD